MTCDPPEIGKRLTSGYQHIWGHERRGLSKNSQHRRERHSRSRFFRLYEVRFSFCICLQQIILNYILAVGGEANRSVYLKLAEVGGREGNWSVVFIKKVNISDNVMCWLVISYYLFCHIALQSVHSHQITKLNILQVFEHSLELYILFIVCTSIPSIWLKFTVRRHVSDYKYSALLWRPTCKIWFTTHVSSTHTHSHIHTYMHMHIYIYIYIYIYITCYLLIYVCLFTSNNRKRKEFVDILKTGEKHWTDPYRKEVLR